MRLTTVLYVCAIRANDPTERRELRQRNISTPSAELPKKAPTRR